MKVLIIRQLSLISGGAGKPPAQAPVQKECPCRKKRKAAEAQTSSLKELIVFI